MTPDEVIRESIREEERCDELLTVKQYADMFGVHIQTVYSTIRNGTLQHHVIRIGRTIRIDVSREIIRQRKAS
jgi:excisionase family DNA binding protein